MNHYIKRSAPLFIAFAALLALSSAGLRPSFSLLADASDVSFILPEHTSFDIHTDLQRSFLENEEGFVLPGGDSELSRPEPVSFAFSVQYPSELELDHYQVALSEDEDLKDATAYRFEDENLKFENLKTGTEYHYQITAVFDSGEKVESEIGSFSVEGGMRNLYISGMTNVRDLGGSHYASAEIKQGYLFRTARPNVSWVNQRQDQITDKGKTQMRELGIKTEVDFRKTPYENGYIYNSVLGKDIAYYSCPMEYATDDFLQENASSIKNAMRVLLNPTNLPAFFHCDAGADRTGVIGYLLNALLGKSQSEIEQDYLFTNFANIGSGRAVESIREKMASLDNYTGNNIAEKAESFLMSLHISKTEIETFQNFMAA